MKICVNHGKIRQQSVKYNGGYFSGYLETLGSSHVVIDTSCYKE